STGSVLNSQTASNFSGGEYLVFTVSGHVNLKFTNLAGPNAVLSGLFFAPPAAAATLQTTTVSSRLWFPCGCPLCTRARAMPQEAAALLSAQADRPAQAGRPASAEVSGDGTRLIGADLVAALPRLEAKHAAWVADAGQKVAELPAPAQPLSATAAGKAA